MKVIIQKVSEANITINSEIERSIGKGFVILLGVTHNDTKADADFLAEKCCGLRVFKDSDGKMNISLKDVGGELLIVSNFTLYGDCRKGKRPNFTAAAAPDEAEPLYEYFVEKCRSYGVNVQTGEFGASMVVNLTNDGPITLEIESCGRG